MKLRILYVSSQKASSDRQRWIGEKWIYPEKTHSRDSAGPFDCNWLMLCALGCIILSEVPCSPFLPVSALSLVLDLVSPPLLFSVSLL